MSAQPPNPFSRERPPAEPPQGWGCLQWGCAVFAVFGVIVILLPPGIPGYPRPAAQRAACQANLKQLGNALKLYVEDYDSRLPPAPIWTDALQKQVDISRLLGCPSDRNRNSYAFHRNLDAVHADKITNQADAPVLYDSTLGVPNATDRGGSFARRHPQRSGNILYLDGHVKWSKYMPAWRKP